MRTTDTVTLAFTDRGENQKTTVLDEIVRLRHAGMNDAADRLESSCVDTTRDTGRYVSVSPVNPADPMGTPIAFVPKAKEEGEHYEVAKRHAGHTYTVPTRISGTQKTLAARRKADAAAEALRMAAEAAEAAEAEARALEGSKEDAEANAALSERAAQIEETEKKTSKGKAKASATPARTIGFGVKHPVASHASAIAGLKITGNL